MFVVDKMLDKQLCTECEVDFFETEYLSKYNDVGVSRYDLRISQRIVEFFGMGGLR